MLQDADSMFSAGEDGVLPFDRVERDVEVRNAVEARSVGRPFVGHAELDTVRSV